MFYFGWSLFRCLFCFILLFVFFSCQSFPTWIDCFWPGSVVGNYQSVHAHTQKPLTDCEGALRSLWRGAIKLRFLFVLARRDRAWVQLPAQPRVLNISALFCISFTTLLLLLLPVLCLLCAVSRSHHTRSGHRNKCWRRCGGVDRTKKKKKKRRKRGNDLITNRRRRRRLDCLHTSLTVCTLSLSICLSVT